MNTRVLIAGFLLGGGMYASAQETFLINFDSIQNGHGALSTAVEEVADGYLVFGQQFSHDSTGSIHIYVRKIGLDGHFILEREYAYGDPRHFNIGYIDPVCVDPNGGFTASVSSYSDTSSYDNRMTLYRFDEQGDTLATHELIRHIPPADSIAINTFQTIPVSSGGYMTVGFFAVDSFPTKGWMVRTDVDLDSLWTRTITTPEGFNYALGAAEYFDGGFLITGYRLLPYVQDNSFLIRTDSLGNQLWRREYGEKASVNGAVRMTLDSNIVTWSEYKEEQLPLDYQQMMLTKWDSTGSIIWQKKSHYGYYSHTKDMEVLADGGYVCSASLTYLGVLARFDENGDSLWSRYYEAFDDNGQSDLLYDVNPTSDGGFILCGYGFQYLDDPHPYLATIFVVKTDSFGCVVPGCQNVGVQEYELGLQERLHVAPNPAKDRVSLELEVPAAYVLNGPVSVIVFDATGREVLRENAEHNSALLTHTLHVADWPPGLYHLHLADQCKWLAGAKVVVE